MKRKILLAALGLIVLAGAVPLPAPAQERPLDVPYVPTRYPVVDEMLRLAKVGPSDFVIDLGCGDGRIVIAAAQKHGARALGVDIDPDRIQEANQNAKAAGVTDKVRFIEGDLFKADIREANVLTMYLLTSVNLKLRPRIIRELMPGTRVVSHNFCMDTWRPDESSVVDVEDVRHDVFLWIVPANISGQWTWALPAELGKTEAVMSVEQRYQVPTATVKIKGAAAEMKAVSLKGAQVRIEMDLPVDGKPVRAVLEGKASGNSITGTIKATAGGRDQTWEWKAQRNPATVKPIDEEPAYIY